MPLSPKYSRAEKKAIAQDVIDYVVKRTKKRLDKNGKQMPGYSKEYAKTPEAKAAGKKAGQSANLNLSGDMLYALGEHTKIGVSYIEIGYKKGSEENGKADGNVRGTYGTSTPKRSKARDFMGIQEKELKNILSDYPLDDKEKSSNSIGIGKLAAALASKVKPKAKPNG